jgi:hypothetical protein
VDSKQPDAVDDGYRESHNEKEYKGSDREECSTNRNKQMPTTMVMTVMMLVVVAAVMMIMTAAAVTAAASVATAAVVASVARLRLPSAWKEERVVRTRSAPATEGREHGWSDQEREEGGEEGVEVVDEEKSSKSNMAPTSLSHRCGSFGTP